MAPPVSVIASILLTYVTAAPGMRLVPCGTVNVVIPLENLVLGSTCTAGYKNWPVPAVIPPEAVPLMSREPPLVMPVTYCPEGIPVRVGIGMPITKPDAPEELPLATSPIKRELAVPLVTQP